MSRPPDPLAAVALLPGVFESVEAARGSVDALLRDLRAPALRQRVTEVTAESVRLAAWASAALDGRVGGADEFVAPVEDLLGANALRLNAALASLAETWEAAPLQALARMHVLASSGLVGDDALGRPVGEEAAGRLEALGEVLATTSAAPAVVVAAVVHGEVLVTDAFGVGTGLVARAASRCVLVARGLDPRAASVPEVGHLELGPEPYALALEGYRSGTADGVADWVSHCAQAVALGGRAGRRVVEQLTAPR